MVSGEGLGRSACQVSAVSTIKYGDGERRITGMKKYISEAPRATTVFLIGCLLGATGGTPTALAANRSVLCEEFTNNW